MGTLNSKKRPFLEWTRGCSLILVWFIVILNRFQQSVAFRYSTYNLYPFILDMYMYIIHTHFCVFVCCFLLDQTILLLLFLHLVHSLILHVLLFHEISIIIMVQRFRFARFLPYYLYHHSMILLLLLYLLLLLLLLLQQHEIRNTTISS